MDAHERAVTPSGDPIMTAKFHVAAIKPAVLMRGRLLNRLSAGVRGPLTLISAPAGSGKTVLASSWVGTGAAPGAVTWISLDEEDDRPGIFWSYVLHGLARSGVSVSEVGTPDQVDSVDQSLLIRLAVELSERSEPVVLILDNAEGLTRHRVAEEIDFVLRHSGGPLRVVLITRVDPNLPLHQYRLDDSVTEIRFADLAFTPDEAKALLAGQNPHLSDDAVLAFAYRTRGWAAGLRLGGVSLRDGNSGKGDLGGRDGRDGRDMDRPGDLPALADGDLAAYFRAEVLDAEPPAVRDFLLATSVVDRLSPGLAVHLSGSRDAARTLRALAQADAFIERTPDAEERYQYHSLIRDLLQAELRQESPAKQRRLHRRAAHWLAAAGSADEAMRHYVAAGDWEDAAALLVEDLGVARLLTTPPAGGLVDLFAPMPANTAGPEAAVVSAALALAKLDLVACEKHLPRAGEIVPAGSNDQVRALRLAIAVIASALASANADAEGTLAAATTAQEVMTDMIADGVVVPPETRALLLLATGVSHLSEGDIGAGREILAAAVRAANVPGREYLRARCLAQLALAEALAGRLRRAADFAGRAVSVAERLGDVGGPRNPVADVALAWVNAEQVDCRRGRTHADVAGAAAQSWHDPVALGTLALARSRLLRAQGDLAGALAAIRDVRSAKRSRPLSPWWASRLDAAEVVLLAAQGRHDAAIELTQRTTPADAPADTPAWQLACGWAMLPRGGAAEARRAASQVLQHPGLPLDIRVDALLLTAASELDSSRWAAAKAALGQALRLAEPEGMRRPFEEAPSRVRAVLRERGDLSDGSWWSAGGAPAGPRGAGAQAVPTADVIVQPLTEREQEVLTYLAALLPTEEIAGRMFVSVNTVKTHVRSILRKLSVERRNQAVRRALELGLIEPDHSGSGPPR
jgi:LuxR family maltose regulon positive regulatory protein